MTRPLRRTSAPVSRDSRVRTCAPLPKPVAAAVALALLALSAAAEDALAAPTGGQVTAGAATINQSGATTVINQSTPRAALNWQSFSIGSAESVIFQQPSSSAVALNRVIGPNPSAIYGTLQANGHVFLINPSGVLFGKGASVDVAGLVASTLNIANSDFMAGRLVFSGGAGSGAVANHGSIRTASGGYVALLGNQVTNAGTIVASNGSVALGAGESMLLDFNGDGLLNLKVNAAAANARIDHSGEIRADGGQVIMSAHAKNALLSTVLNVEGMVTARGIVERGGYIYLDGGRSGVTNVSGVVDASSAQAKGGEIKVLGEYVGLFGNAKLDASGDKGGGTVLVGGDFQGKNPDVPNAARTYIGKDTVIKADATAQGDGGKVIVWSDEYTRFDGAITARGGAAGGDGGFVETSGKALLHSSGSVDASAPHGKPGTWLLDPFNVTITNATAGGGFDGGNPNTFTPNADDATIDAATINAALDANTSVTITTGAGGSQDGDITVAAAITKSAGGGAATLQLNAADDIFVNQPITGTSGTLGITLLASNLVNNGGGASDGIQINAALASNGGDINLNSIPGAGGAATFTQTAGAANTISSGSGAITINADAIVLNTSANTITGTGPITLQPVSLGRPVVIGADGTATQFALSTAEIGALTNGFSSITIGRADAISTATVSAVTFNDPVVIRQAGAGGAIQVNGAITGADNASVTLDAGTGGLTLDAPISTAAGSPSASVILSSGGAITTTANGAIATPGRIVTLTAGDTITVGAAISTRGADSAGGGTTGGAGGEIFLHHTTAVADKPIVLNAALDASGGNAIDAMDTSGAGGIVTVYNASGNIAISNNILAREGMPSGGGASGDGGTIRLKTGGTGNTITQASTGSRIAVTRAALPPMPMLGLLVDSAGDVLLNGDGTNYVGTIAGRTRDPGASFSYRDGWPYIVGTVTPSGNAAATAGLVQLFGITTNGGAIAITAGGALTVNSAITSTASGNTGANGGSVTLKAGGAITSGAGGTITTTGGTGTTGTAQTGPTMMCSGFPVNCMMVPGMAAGTGGAGGRGGDIFLHSVGGSANITLGAALTSGGGTGGMGGNGMSSGGQGGVGGPGGVVTVRNDTGAIALHNVTTPGGAGGADGSGAAAGSVDARGDIQLQSAGGAITQADNTSLVTNRLKAISNSAVTLTQTGNDAETVAASITGSGTFSYRNGSPLEVGSVPDGLSALAGANLDPVIGITTAGGAVTLASRALTVSEAIVTTPGVSGTAGGSVSLTSTEKGITTSGNGAITTTGAAGAPGGAGGHVLLRSTTAAGDITLEAAITASGGAGAANGNDGGRGGVITLLNENGAIVTHNLTTRGGASGGGGGVAGADGTVQLSATDGITQTPGTSLQAGSLKVISGADTVLTEPANNVSTLAARVSNGAAFSYTDANALTVGTVESINSLGQRIDELTGIDTSGASADINGPGAPGGNVTLTTLNGPLTAGDITTSGGHANGNNNDNGAAAGLISFNVGGGNALTLTGTLSSSGGSGVGTGNGGAGNTIVLPAVILGGNATIITRGGSGAANGADGEVTFNGTVGADDSAAQDRTLSIFGGRVVFRGEIGVGAGRALANLYVSGSPIEFEGARIIVSDSGGGAQTVTFDGPVILVGNEHTVDTGANSVTFGGTVNGGSSLVVNSAGATTFTGAVGDTFALRSLTTDAPGTTAINGGLVDTNFSTTQIYKDPVTLGADTLLNAGPGAILFESTLDSAPGTSFSLTANSTAATTFAKAVGGIDRLSTLETNAAGTTVVSGGSVRTTGNQTFRDPVTVSVMPATFDAGTGTLAFNSTLAAAANAVTLIADEINFSDTPNSVTGTGALTLQPSTQNRTILVASAAEDGDRLDLLVSDISAIANGFSSITIGREMGTGTTTVNAVTFNDPVTIRQPGTAGAVSVNGLITGADNASVTLTAGSGGITLDNNISTNGNAITLNGPTILARNVTLDTEINNAGAGGAVNLSNALVSGNAGGRRLTIDTSAGIGTGGAISLGTFAGETPVTSILLTTSGGGGGAAGTITLNGNIQLDDNGPMTPGDFTLNNATNVVLAADVTIDTERGNNASGGTVNLANAVFSANAPGRTLRINTATERVGASGAGVFLGRFDSTPGGSFVQAVDINSTPGAGGTAGALRLNGDVLLDNGPGGAAASFDFNGGGLVIVAANTTIDTEQGNDAAGGRVLLGSGSVSVNTQGRSFTINTSTGALNLAGGAVTFGPINNAGGVFLQTFSADTRATTAGVITLDRDIRVDDNGMEGPALAPGSVTLAGDVRLGAIVTIDTQQGDNAAGGAVTLTNAAISGTAAGRALTINTSTTAAGAAAGVVSLGAFGSAGGSRVQDLAVTTTPGTGGSLAFAGAVDVGTITANTSGSITQTAPITAGASSFTAGANPITLTNAGNNFTGAVTLSNSGANDVAITDSNALALAASTVGRDLTVVAGGAITQTGALTIPGASSFTAGANPITLTNAGNNFTGAVTLSNSGANDVAITDANAIAIAASTVGRDLTVVAGGAITQTGALTIPGASSFTAGANPITLTNAGNNFTGAVTLSNSGANDVAIADSNVIALAASTVGRDLTVSAGGAITLPAIATPGTQTYTGTSITLNGDLSTTNSALTFNGPVVLGGNRTLDAGSGALLFGGTVNGAFSLIANSTGTAIFGGAVGATTALTSLSTNFGGTTAINGGAVRTSGNQLFNDPVVIGANSTLTSTGGNVTFGGSLNADLAASNRTLTLNAIAGSVTFSGNVGNTQPFADFDVNAGPNTIVFNAGTPQSISVTAQGGNTITFTGPALLLQNVTLSTNGATANNVTFVDAVNAGGAGTRTFILNAGTGAVNLGLVGNTAPLGVLNVTGNTVTFSANAISSQVAVTANQLLLGANGQITATLPFASFAAAEAGLTLSGSTTDGIFGTEAVPLLVSVPGFLRVIPDAGRASPTVWLRGDPATKPFYQHYDDSTRREVVYSGRPAARGSTSSRDNPDMYEDMRRFGDDGYRDTMQANPVDVSGSAGSPGSCRSSDSSQQQELNCSGAGK